uniref:Uncharacterized protein n=1 Tax=Phaeomonas parva TaxID=124430 RepID=A0A7S1XZ00_9STRA|mmetsp:Transcript_7992/g.22808  ORF Transcript_7992/g.22808 Transcript_7992/m.22808 type:complete len:527 (+) Transcript_7992:204-1784(+)
MPGTGYKRDKKTLNWHYAVQELDGEPYIVRLMEVGPCLLPCCVRLKPALATALNACKKGSNGFVIASLANEWHAAIAASGPGSSAPSSPSKRKSGSIRDVLDEMRSMASYPSEDDLLYRLGKVTTVRTLVEADWREVGFGALKSLRKKHREKLFRRITDALTVQDGRVFVGWHWVVERVEHEDEAATKLQAVARRRGAQAKVAARREERVRDTCATKIQAMARRRKAARDVALRREQTIAATKIESLFRARRARQEVEQHKARFATMRLESQQAVVIQAAARRRMAMKTVKEERARLEVVREEEAAVVIGKHVRGMKARRQVKPQRAALLIQRNARRRQAWKMAEELRRKKARIRRAELAKRQRQKMEEEKRALEIREQRAKEAKERQMREWQKTKALERRRQRAREEMDATARENEQEAVDRQRRRRLRAQQRKIRKRMDKSRKRRKMKTERLKLPPMPDSPEVTLLRLGRGEDVDMDLRLRAEVLREKGKWKLPALTVHGDPRQMKKVTNQMASDLFYELGIKM